MRNKKIKKRKLKMIAENNENYVKMKIKNGFKIDKNNQKICFQIFWLKNNFLKIWEIT